jgi:hypothetical protein
VCIEGRQRGGSVMQRTVQRVNAGLQLRGGITVLGVVARLRQPPW